MTNSQRVTFAGGTGQELSGILEAPNGTPTGYALYAHCFTCSKEISAAVRISRELAALGIATLRFDFSGIGKSGGDFADTTFSSDIKDIHAAADFLRNEYEAPTIVIGHSLGGAAILGAAGEIKEAKAVVAIGAPAEPEHVAHLFEKELDKICSTGAADVDLAGRHFTISKEFVEDIKGFKLKEKIAELNKALLILHSPIDNTVGIENAQEIYIAAKHPKSFISLDHADHLLSKREDADYAAQVIAAWAGRYIEQEKAEGQTTAANHGETIVEETGTNPFARIIHTAGHQLRADEPLDFGGGNTGPGPYDLLLSALGACVSMTVRMYADRKKWPLEKVGVRLTHEKIHATDCAECETKEGKIDRIDKYLSFEGNLSEEQRARLLEISEKCPVNRTLKSEISIHTHAEEPTQSNAA